MPQPQFGPYLSSTQYHVRPREDEHAGEEQEALSSHVHELCLHLAQLGVLWHASAGAHLEGLSVLPDVYVVAGIAQICAFGLRKVVSADVLVGTEFGRTQLVMGTDFLAYVMRSSKTKAFISGVVGNVSTQ